MFTHNLIHRSLAIGFALTLTGYASARRPAPLVAEQTRVAEVLATCEDPAQLRTNGYRDMLTRANAPKAPTTVASMQPRLQRMNDHVVLVCEGGLVHGPGGYRDIDVRFRVDDPTPLVATRPAYVANR